MESIDGISKEINKEYVEAVTYYERDIKNNKCESIESYTNLAFLYWAFAFDYSFNDINAFPLRMYDARLGRWLRTDPFYQHSSAYLAMSNNPISFVDPTGGYDIDEFVIVALTARTFFAQHDFSFEYTTRLQNDFLNGKFDGGPEDLALLIFARQKQLSPTQVSNQAASRYASQRAKSWSMNSSLRSKYSATDWKMRNKLVKGGTAFGRGILAAEANGKYLKMTDPSKPYASFATKWNKQGVPDLGETANFWMNATTALVGGTILAVVAAPMAIAGLEGAGSAIFTKSTIKISLYKTAISSLTQATVNKEINLVGAFADGFLTPGSSAAIGAAFEINVTSGGFQTSSVFGSKSGREFAIDASVGFLFNKLTGGASKKFAPGSDAADIIFGLPGGILQEETINRINGQ